MPQFGCDRGHQWIETGEFDPKNFRGCPMCHAENQREQQKAALHAPAIKAAVAEALREFLPELIEALKQKPN